MQKQQAPALLFSARHFYLKITPVPEDYAYSRNPMTTPPVS